MKQIRLDDIINIDNKLIDKNILIHQRPYHAATEISHMKRISNDCNILEYVNNLYRVLYPSQKFDFPSLLIGGVVFRDQLYIARIPLIYGVVELKTLELKTLELKILDIVNIKESELKIINKFYPEQFQQAKYSISDLLDIALGIDDLYALDKNNSPSHWLRKILSNIRSTAFSLSENIDLDSTLQSSLLSIELAAKYCLSVNGYTDKDLKNISHNKNKMINELLKIYNFDKRFCGVFNSLPDYVETRYSETNFRKIDFVNLAVNTQYVVAEIIRMMSGRNMLNEQGPVSY